MTEELPPNATTIPLHLSVDPYWDSLTAIAFGLVGVSVGEILLAVQGRYRENEPTADALHFHAAIAAGGEDHKDVIEAEGSFRLALEAGDMKALFGLGYTLVEAGRPDEAYDALRRYTGPSNAWAWFWLGRPRVDMGAEGEARSAFERALACEEEGSFETDAHEYLEELSS